MNASWSIVEHLEDQVLDLRDPQGRFRRSEWNYCLTDPSTGTLSGYWVAEAGHEDLGDDDFVEVLHVISGALYVTCAGQEHVAGPGDTVVVQPGRPMRIAVREPVRAFFVCFGMKDPAGYAAGVRQAMAARGL